MTKTLCEVLSAATDAVRSMTWRERVRGVEMDDPCADLPQCPHTRVIGYCQDCEIEELRAQLRQSQQLGHVEYCDNCASFEGIDIELERAREERDEMREVLKRVTSKRQCEDSDGFCIAHEGWFQDTPIDMCPHGVARKILGWDK